MVKFSRQLDAQMIPEWKEAFVNYRQLKKNVKKVKYSRPNPIHLLLNSSSSVNEEYRDVNGSFRFSLLNPIRRLVSRSKTQQYYNYGHHHHSSSQTVVEEEEDQYDVELMHYSREDEVKKFFERLDEELQKVNQFYVGKEEEFVERSEILNKQLQILVDLKKILHERRRLRHLSSSAENSSHLSRINSPSNFSSGSVTETDEPPSLSELSSPVDELVAALERNGVTFINSTRSKAKKGGKPKTTSMRIDIPITTPTRTISALTSMMWEDVVNSSNTPKKESGDYITRKKIQCAEKMIRGAFVELYRGLGLLKTYSSLNVMAFRKILKKFDKVSDQQESGTYLRKVKRSHFVSSDKVVRLEDEVECKFTKHFASNDRKKAMKFLRPQQTKESHVVTFFVGILTGSFVTLFSVYGILAHMLGIFSSTAERNGSRYMETVYPIFSMFSLLSLHLFLYGCNLYAWRSTRINNNFIFEFSPSTALRYRDAFLISAGLMTVVVGGMVLHLFLISSGVSPHHVDSIPGLLLLFFTLLLFFPFNVCYRSTRFCFLRVIRNIVLSPFYTVLMVDFFMADQLTSQIPLMRHMEFTACFFMTGGFKNHSSYATCSNNRQYKFLSYVISFLPYYWRAMQCMRRFMEEGYDMNHIANAGKYISAMVAAAARMKYAMTPTPFWMAVVVASSCGATVYQLYWDFVKDWGFFNMNSSNPFLRDELVLKTRTIYYLSITLNFVLRLAWIQTITHFSLGNVENKMIEFLLASLEVIRRGHWNFYRLENEHLNNVGKFRAVKAVPLPFREMDSED